MIEVLLFVYGMGCIVLGVTSLILIMYAKMDYFDEELSPWQVRALVLTACFFWAWPVLLVMGALVGMWLGLLRIAEILRTGKL